MLVSLKNSLITASIPEDTGYRQFYHFRTTLLTNQAQNHRYKRSNLNKCSVQFKKLKNVDNKDEKLLMRKTQQCRYGKSLKNKNRTAILNFIII
ncbi:hypothetical protein T06_11940 [Trichinella sp. T6]|nr:hypothetical protein T06_11940 [Trichinella sp. T6]